MPIDSFVNLLNETSIKDWIIDLESKYHDLKKKVKGLNLDSWPIPFSRKPSYLVHNNIKKLEELTDENLNSVVESILISLDLSKFNEEEKNIIAKSMIILNSVFWNFEKNEAKKRKYESVYSLTHLLTVAALFENTDLETLLVALNHDTIEDSYRHKVLKRYYLGENISEEDARLVGLTKEDLKINDKRIKKHIYHRLLEKLIENTISLIGVRCRETESLKLCIDALTHRVYESYETYIKRLVRTAKKLNAEGYKLILIKSYDRLDNSHFNPHYNMPEIFRKEGPKVLRDAVKDVFVLEAISDYLANEKKLDDKQIEELLKVKVALGALLNRNMNQLMIYIRENYGDMRLKINDEENTLEYWFNESEKRLFKYYKKGGFNQRDINPSSNNPNEIFKYSGSITSLSLFIEEKGYNLFKNLNEALEILNLYKFCAVAKAIGCLNAGYNPFINGRLNLNSQDKFELDTLGLFDKKLIIFQIKGVV